MVTFYIVKKHCNSLDIVNVGAFDEQCLKKCSEKF